MNKPAVERIKKGDEVNRNGFCLTKELYENYAKKINFLAFFLLYLWFAVLILQSTLAAEKLNFDSFLGININSFLGRGFLTDVYLAGAVDIAIGFLLGLVIFTSDLRGSPREPLGKLQGSTRLFQYISLIGEFCFLIVAIYLAVIWKYFSSAGPLFFGLLVLYIVRNLGYVLLGRKKEIIQQRFNMVYGAGIISVFIAGVIFLIMTFIGQAAPPESPTYIYITQSLPLLIANVVSLYYLVLALSNFWQVLPTRKTQKANTQL